MGILETLIIIFLSLFVIALILHVILWLSLPFLVIGLVLFIIHGIKKIFSKLD